MNCKIKFKLLHVNDFGGTLEATGQSLDTFAWAALSAPVDSMVGLTHHLFGTPVTNSYIQHGSYWENMLVQPFADAWDADGLESAELFGEATANIAGTIFGVKGAGSVRAGGRAAPQGQII